MKEKTIMNLIILMFVLQIGVILELSWFFAYGKAESGPGFGFLAIFFISMGVNPIMGIAGLIMAIVSIRKKIFLKTSTVLVATSIFMLSMVFPVSLAKKMSVIFSPLAEKEFNSKIKEMNQRSEDAENVHYGILVEYFKESRKVVEAKGEDLLLEDGKILTLFSLDPGKRSEIEKYVNEFLVGKNIVFELPEYKEFARLYTAGSRSGAFQSGKYEWPRDPQLNMPYGPIPVYITENREFIKENYGYKVYGK